MTLNFRSLIIIDFISKIARLVFKRDIRLNQTYRTIIFFPIEYFYFLISLRDVVMATFIFSFDRPFYENRES